MDKWCSKGGHSPLDYDDKFQQFTRTIVEVDSMALTKDLGCIRLHMGPLADGVKQHANQWIRIYGDRLQQSASQNLVSLQQLLVVTTVFLQLNTRHNKRDHLPCSRLRTSR